MRPAVVAAEKSRDLRGTVARLLLYLGIVDQMNDLFAVRLG